MFSSSPRNNSLSAGDGAVNEGPLSMPDDSSHERAAFSESPLESSTNFQAVANNRGRSESLPIPQTKFWPLSFTAPKQTPEDRMEKVRWFMGAAVQFQGNCEEPPEDRLRAWCDQRHVDVWDGDNRHKNFPQARMANYSKRSDRIDRRAMHSSTVNVVGDDSNTYENHSSFAAKLDLIFTKLKGAGTVGHSSEQNCSGGASEFTIMVDVTTEICRMIIEDTNSSVKDNQIVEVELGNRMGIKLTQRLGKRKAKVDGSLGMNGSESAAAASGTLVLDTTETGGSWDCDVTCPCAQTKSKILEILAVKTKPVDPSKLMRATAIFEERVRGGLVESVVTTVKLKGEVTSKIEKLEKEAEEYQKTIGQLGKKDKERDEELARQLQQKDGDLAEQLKKKDEDLAGQKIQLENLAQQRKWGLVVIMALALLVGLWVANKNNAHEFELDACQSDLGSCHSTLTTVANKNNAHEFELDAYKSDLGSCHSTLTTYQSDVGSCHSTLMTYQLDVGSCHSTLTTIVNNQRTFVMEEIGVNLNETALMHLYNDVYDGHFGHLSANFTNELFRVAMQDSMQASHRELQKHIANCRGEKLRCDEDKRRCHGYVGGLFVDHVEFQFNLTRGLKQTQTHVNDSLEEKSLVVFDPTGEPRTQDAQLSMKREEQGKWWRCLDEFLKNTVTRDAELDKCDKFAEINDDVVELDQKARKCAKSGWWPGSCKDEDNDLNLANLAAQEARSMLKNWNT